MANVYHNRTWKMHVDYKWVLPVASTVEVRILTPYSDGSTFIRPLGRKWIDPISFKTFLFHLQGYQIALLMIEDKFGFQTHTEIQIGYGIILSTS